MFKIKRDYLSSSKAMIVLSFGLMTLLAIVFLFIKNVSGEVFWKVNYEFVDRIVIMGTMFICFIPLCTFGCIFPTSEKTFGGKVKTNHLPFSNKQLAWKGIKLWLLVYPIWFVVAAFIHLLYEKKAINNLASTMATAFSMNSDLEIILFTIGEIVVITMFVLIADMQIVSSMIIVFAKRIKVFWIILVQALSNAILISLTIVFIIRLNLDTSINAKEGLIAVAIISGILLVPTIIYFVYSLKYIEKVYR